MDGPQIGEDTPCPTLASSFSAGFLNEASLTDAWVLADELKELVKVSLSQAGVLGSIKAQLRVGLPPTPTRAHRRPASRATRAVPAQPKSPSRKPESRVFGGRG